MSLSKAVGLGLILCSLLDPGAAEAHRPHWMRRPARVFNQCGAPLHACCGPAIDPCCTCSCAPLTQPVYQTQMRPVAQTTLEPRQVVTYQNVPQVQYQRQAYVENVPVTTQQTVTVDEGGYQMVWVPRPVQKQVAQTVLQPQVRYRDVAVQVNRQVAQVQTQLIPRQTVSYIPETRQIGTQFLGTQMAVYPGIGYPVIGGIPTVPTTAGMPIYGQTTQPVPDPAGAEAQQPAPYMQGASATDDWSTIRQRGSEGAQSATHPPSAATIWQSQLQSGAVAR